MEIVETAKDIFSSNGGKLAIAVGGGLILYVAIKSIQENASLTVVAPTGYTSYPDAEKNANVIIDQVNQHTTYENELTRDDIADLGDYMTGRFDSTDGYIKDGFDNLNSNLNQWGDKIIGNQDEWGGTIMGGIGDLSSQMEQGFDSMHDRFDNVDSSLSGLHDKTDSILSGIGDIKNDLNTLPQADLGNSGDMIVTDTPKKPSSNSSYYKKFQYGGNWDSNSIVDGFKSIGVFSNDGKRIDTVASRKEIAEANGIKNYTGTAAQNTKLVNLGKQGKLKKPK